MNLSIMRRSGIMAACVVATALWAGPSSAASESFQVQLSGAQQVPAVQTDGTGTADLTYNPTTRVVTWSISYSGLASPVIMAHFHQAAAGQNGPVKVWLTKRGSPVSNPITGRAKLTAAEAKEFLAGNWYINVHTKDHPAGAIRGQVMPPSS